MFGDVLFRVLCSGDFLNFLLDTEVQCIFGRGRLRDCDWGLWSNSRISGFLSFSGLKVFGRAKGIGAWVQMPIKCRSMNLAIHSTDRTTILG